MLGPKGAGKTSVAAAAYHDARITSVFGKQRGFISCSRLPGGTSLLGAICGGFARVGFEGNSLEALSEYLEDKAGPTLLVLDHFEEVQDGDQNAKVIEALSASKSLTILMTMGDAITTRIRWTRPRLEPIPDLPVSAAMKAFAAICRKPQAEKDLEELFRNVDCNAGTVSHLARLGKVGFSASDILDR